MILNPKKKTMKEIRCIVMMMVTVAMLISSCRMHSSVEKRSLDRLDDDQWPVAVTEWKEALRKANVIRWKEPPGGSHDTSWQYLIFFLTGSDRFWDSDNKFRQDVSRRLIQRLSTIPLPAIEEWHNLIGDRRGLYYDALNLVIIDGFFDDDKFNEQSFAKMVEEHKAKK